MKKAYRILAKVIVNTAIKVAGIEANTACRGYSYQPSEPKEVKRLRKF